MLLYRNLVGPNSITDKIPGETLVRSIVLRDEVTNQYYVFPSYATAFHFIYKRKPDDRTFHEVILADFVQKPRFDIDLTSKNKLPDGYDLASYAAWLLETVIDVTLKTLNRHDVIRVNRSNVSIYTSNGMEGDVVKYSYHIIINSVVHTNHEQAEAFFKEVTAQMEHTEGLDNIYSKNHNLRLLWNHKANSSRFKQILVEQADDYETDNEMVIVSRQFARSLVRPFGEHVSIIPDVDIPEKFKSAPLPPEVYAGAFNEIVQHCDKTLGGMPFAFKATQGSNIYVLRNATTMCPCCLREHKNRTPFYKLRAGNIYYCCKGNESNVDLLVGTYQVPVEIPITMECTKSSALELVRQVAAGTIIPPPREEVVYKKREVLELKDVVVPKSPVIVAQNSKSKRVRSPIVVNAQRISSQAALKSAQSNNVVLGSGLVLRKTRMKRK
jgi:hypothetical protein